MPYGSPERTGNTTPPAHAESRRNHGAYGTASWSPGASGSVAEGVAATPEMPVPRQCECAGRAHPVLSPPAKHSKGVERAVTRAWGRRQKMEQCHDAALDGERSRERGIASEPSRPPIYDETDASGGAPRSSTGSVMVGDKRPRCSMSSPCGSAPCDRKRREGRRRTCGLPVCGSGLQYTRGSAGTCGDCGDGVTHGEDELLCAACHRTLGTPPLHLGNTLRRPATAWVEECRSTGAGLPARVLRTFRPSKSCLCQRTDCFYKAFERYRRQSAERRCTPCGTKTTSQWQRLGPMCRQYQVFFSDGAWSKRAGARMAAAKEAITAENWICCACRGAFAHAVRKGWRPTLEALMASPCPSLPPRGPDHAVATVTRSVQESLARGEVLCLGDIARSLRHARQENACVEMSDRTIRSMARKILTGIQGGVSDVCLDDFSGPSFGERWRTKLTYIAVMPLELDRVIALGREIRRKGQEISHLEGQLREARGEVISEVSARQARGDTSE